MLPHWSFTSSPSNVWRCTTANTDRSGWGFSALKASVIGKLLWSPRENNANCSDDDWFCVRLSGVENPFANLLLSHLAFAELSRFLRDHTFSFRGPCFHHVCFRGAVAVRNPKSWKSSWVNVLWVKQLTATSLTSGNVPDVLQRPWRPATFLMSWNVPDVLKRPCMTSFPSVTDFGVLPCWLCFGFRGAFAELSRSLGGISGFERN